MELTPFILTILGNLVIAIGIIIVVLITKFLRNKATKYLEYITALTVGLLLGIIFLGFIPKLTDSGLVGKELGIFILIGLFFFYLLELFMHWHHCKDLAHESACHSNHTHEHKNGLLMFGGTIMHNSFHGIVLFSAFAVDIKFGMATTIAVLLHSIPQNIVNYIMNHHNIKYAYFAAIGGLLGALLTYPFADFLVTHKFHILAIITGGLLYTALADIFPEFKGKGTTIKKISYFIFIIIGIFIFLGFEKISHHSHEHGDTEVHKHVDEHESIEHECEEHGGKWIDSTSECEGISNNVCEELGGDFNGCASACRNNPETEMCTMQCIQVCEFNK